MSPDTMSVAMRAPTDPEHDAMVERVREMIRSRRGVMCLMTENPYDFQNVQGLVLDAIAAERDRAINTPETRNFIRAVGLEAEHQLVRHGNDQSWLERVGLVAHLAGKSFAALVNHDFDKAKHHTISTAAACLNWHRHIVRFETKVAEETEVYVNRGNQ